YSQTKGSPTGDLGHRPFLLSQQHRDSATRFDCDFVVRGTRYHYGFCYTKARFEEEWLYAFPGGKPQLWYSRTANRPKIKFGKSLKGQNRSIEGLMRQNSLFLSTAAQNAHAQLLPLYEFFEKDLTVRVSANVSSATLEHELAKRPLRSNIVDFL